MRTQCILQTTLRLWLSAVVATLIATTPLRAESEQRTYQRGNLILPAALLEKRISSVKYEHSSWRNIAEDVFRRLGLKLVFDTEEGFASSQDDLTITATNGTFAMLLRPLFHSHPRPDLTIDDKGVFHVIPSLKGSGLAGRPDLDTRKFTIVESDAPVRTLLVRLFQEANVPYEIDPAVTGSRGISYRGVLFRRTLISLLRHNRGGPELTYRVENGKFIVYPKEKDEKGSVPPSAVPN